MTAWGWTRTDRSDNFAVLADCWLHGHAYIADFTSAGANLASAAVDALTYRGHGYVIEGPFPAVLLLPAVAAFGASPLVQDAASRIVGIADVALMWRLVAAINVPRRWRYGLVAFGFLSTDLFWCSAEGSVFFFSPAVAFGLTCAALTEAIGGKRSWLLAVLACAAAFTRFPLVAALPIYLIMARDRLPFVLVCWLSFAGWIGYNEARWGTWNDMGYQLFCAQDPGCGMGLAGPQYLGYEIYEFFVQAPTLIENQYHIAQWPYLGISDQGLSLTWSSPALVLAFYARDQRLLWLAATLVAIPSITYYLDGWIQVGMRHALDFEPFLLALMAVAVRDKPRRWFGPLIAASVAVGVWQAWYAHSFRCC